LKIRKVAIENVRSFLERQVLEVPGDLSIVIGPNGGGKTNLLDTAVIALRHFILKSWVPRHSPAADWQDRYEWVQNDAIQPGALEKHSMGSAKDQIIELELEVTATDINNLKQAKADANDLKEKSKSRYTTFPGESAAAWDVETIHPGVRFTYVIRNRTLESPKEASAKIYLDYLATYEIHARLREEASHAPLSTPMIFLPVNRSGAEVAQSISLASFNEYESKRNVDAATSRSAGSIFSLAVGRLATRFRILLEEDKGNTAAKHKEDPSLQSFSKVLKSLGYDWNLKCVVPIKNQYEIQLTKQDSTFRAAAASSGERELLTYLFAIYVLNVRDALILIDEPELHLHPRWQRTLLSMFESLASETGNQFVMATHSPMFVSPSSIQYVSRVYSESQKSRILRLGDEALPDSKHLFNIVNSQNNERLFFADLVILVEGISDRIFFESLLRHFKLNQGSGAVYEVVSVGGKTLFGQYQKLLAKCKVRHVVMADLDYVRQVGTEQIKGLFTVSAKAIKDKVVSDHSSIDAKSLLERMDEAIKTGSTNDLQPLWEYIKERQSVLKADLSEEERGQLVTFIADQRAQGVYILERGTLETYLPEGFRSKDVEKLIAFTADSLFWDKLPKFAQDELNLIVSDLKNRSA